MSEIIAVKTRIIFSRKEVEKTTASGIVLSAPIDQQNPLGYVTSIGPEVNIEGLQIGDAISVNWQTVGMIENNGEKFYIVDQSSVNAIVRT
jgi:co-chaperonin GroES (HSP10)